MRRRIFLSALGGAASAACVGFDLEASDSPVRERVFELSCRATVKALPAGAGMLELWMPAPHSDPWQEIRDLKIVAAQYGIEQGSEGNRMLHARLPNPGPGEFSTAISLIATRKEHRMQAASEKGSEPADPARYLGPDRLVPIDGQIRAWAAEVVAAANARTNLEKARAIYNHVVATVKYDKTGKGWGRGDIYYACDARRGNCTDFHAIFIGYCRAMGVPARFAIGVPLPADRGSGMVAGYHCWAEFFAPEYGWAPIDASEAAKNPTKREYFFGAHDENRLEFSKGRDVMLAPPQKGEPLNYFVYPYAELDGKPWTSIESLITYRDLSSQRTG